MFGRRNKNNDGAMDSQESVSTEVCTTNNHGRGITAEEVLNVLRHDGFFPELNVDYDSVVDVKYQGNRIHIEIIDNEYVRITMRLGFNEGEFDHLILHRMANYVAETVRCIKVILLKEVIVFAVEFFVSGISEFANYYKRYLDIIVESLYRSYRIYQDHETESREGQTEKSYSNTESNLEFMVSPNNQLKS